MIATRTCQLSKRGAILRWQRTVYHEGQGSFVVCVESVCPDHENATMQILSSKREHRNIFNSQAIKKAAFGSQRWTILRPLDYY
jgi:hypothetical protein